MAETISRRSIVYDILFEVKEGKKSVKEATDTIVKMGDELDKTAKKSQSLTAELRALKSQLGREDFGSKRFVELSIEAAKVQDKIENINQRVRNLASNTKYIDALISATQGLAGAFAVAQGASALLGSENQDLQKGLLKIQASIAILNGLQQVQATLMTESAAKTIIVTTAQKAYNFVISASTVLTKAFRAALIATGAGAVLAGIAAIVAYWEDIKAAIGGSNKELEKYNKAIISQAQRQSKILRAQGESDYKQKKLILLTELQDTKKTEEEISDIKAELKVLEIERANELRKQRLEDAVSSAETELAIQEELSKAQLQATIKLLNAQEALEIDAADDNVAKIIEIDQKYYNLKLKAEKDFQKRLFDARKAENTEVPGLTVEGVPSKVTSEMQKLTNELYIQQQAWEDLNGSMAGWIKLADGTMIKGTIPAVTGGLRDMTQKGIIEQKDALLETIGAVAVYTDALASSANSLAGLAEEGSKAQIALAEIGILASYASSIASAIQGALASSAATTVAAVVTAPTFIAQMLALTIGAFAQSFAMIKKAKSLQGGGGAINAVAFAEGEVDIHRSGETRGKDSIPAVIMPGESVIRTDRTSQYKPELQAIQAGNLEELIRVNYVEPALAMQALDSSVSGAAAPDYSDRLYRQYLLTGEGNMSSKRMVRYLASIDKKLTPTDKRYSR